MLKGDQYEEASRVYCCFDNFANFAYIVYCKKCKDYRREPWRWGFSLGVIFEQIKESRGENLSLKDDAAWEILNLTILPFYWEIYLFSMNLGTWKIRFCVL